MPRASDLFRILRGILGILEEKDRFILRSCASSISPRPFNTTFFLAQNRSWSCLHSVHNQLVCRHQRWQIMALFIIPFSGSWTFLSLPTFCILATKQLAIHLPCHSSHRLACTQSPPRGISLRTSYSQKSGWSCAWTGVRSSEEGPAFSQVVTILPCSCLLHACPLPCWHFLPFLCLQIAFMKTCFVMFPRN